MLTSSPFNALFTFGKTDQTTAVVPDIELRALDLISNFYVICPRLMRKEEEEHKRILYYFPDVETPKRKAEITGMGAGVIGFTNELLNLEKTNNSKQRRRHRFIWSTKTASIVLPVESDFIIGVTFNREICDSKQYYPHCGTLLKMMENIYETYKLFYGPFKLEFEKETKTKELELTLNIFFSNYLPTIKLSTVPLIDYLDGIGFMPLKPKLFLEVQCFIEQATEECPQIRQLMFLYQSRLVQHSIEKTALKTLFRFIIEYMIPHASSKELQPEFAKSTESGSFVEASFDFTSQAGPYPKVKLMNEETGEFETYHLIIYYHLNATLCMIMNENSNPAPALTRLHPFLQIKMSELGTTIGEMLTDVNRPIAAGTPFHFIYYNYDSLSFRTSLKVVAQPGHIETITFTKETNRAIYNSFDKFIEKNDENAYLDLQVQGDLWIGFKRANQRILVIFLSNAAVTNIESMRSAVKSIIDSTFDHILLE